jgi:regulator of protease activity HflC (stomatin/prohibitin superfamily)
LGETVNGTTAAWGIRIEMVEMKDVEIPTAIQRAMAREAKAVREKRARLIGRRGVRGLAEADGGCRTDDLKPDGP